MKIKKRFSHDEMYALITAVEALDNATFAIDKTDANFIDSYLKFKTNLKLTAEEAMRQHEELANGEFSDSGKVLWHKIWPSS